MTPRRRALAVVESVPRKDVSVWSLASTANFHHTDLQIGDLLKFVARFGQGLPIVFRIAGIYSGGAGWRKQRAVLTRRDRVELVAVGNDPETRVLRANSLEVLATWHRLVDAEGNPVRED